MASASTGVTSSEGAGPNSNPRQEGNPRGGGGGRGRSGRGRGQGGQTHGGQNQGRGHGQGRSDGRGGRRSGGGRGGSSAGATNRPSESTTPSTGPKKLPAAVPGRDGAADGEEDLEAEVCFICASPVVHNSVAPCNHRTCHICALRMRALYKTKDCAHCRTPAQFVIFTDDASKRFEEYTEADLTFTDQNIGIKYERNEILEDTLLLLRYNCPDGDCDVACLGWPDLHRHVRSAHHKKMCDLCSRHKKVFTHEHELFTDKELERHMKKGDDNPGAIDQSGFKGHPLCGFCGQRFYGDDELFIHCRDKHERCFICDRRGGQPQYYVDYNSLEAHFKNDHFMCMDRGCLEKKFIVFSSEMDLKAHQLQEHGDTLSKDVRRDARVVDISSFDYRAPYVQERRGGNQREQREGREGRGRGRGRDPNSEPIPASSAQPLRRDEQAFQRQLAIHSAQSVTSRTFGGQLTPSTTPTPAAASTTSRPTEPPRIRTPVESAVASSTVDFTPQDQARQLRHRTVVERATILLQNDESRLTQFRNYISSYKSNSITATNLIDSFFSLFSDASSTALGTLVREVADLYEDKSKADGLRTAWNDWRAINEDYPSLPTTGLGTSSLPLGWASVTASSVSAAPSAGPAASTVKSKRVLKLKSSTAQSSRSSVSQTRSWGSASSASSSGPPEAFPGLPSQSRSSRGPISSSASNLTSAPWLKATTGSGSSSSLTPPARPTPVSQAASQTTTPSMRSRDNFPALPPAAKPQTSIFGYGSGMVRRDLRGNESSAAPSAWTPGGSGPGTRAEGDVDGEGDHGMVVKKKGNKGKKQVLMNWG